MKLIAALNCFNLNQNLIYATIGHGGESDVAEESCGGLPRAGDRHQWGTAG